MALTAAALTSSLFSPAAQATAPSADATQVRAPVPVIDWGPCGEGLEAFECATTEVPTDYDKPRGATTTIALTRLPATGPGERIGSLFTNPGGPGGSGVEFLHGAGEIAYAPQVRERFDLIGFDPRGVAGSDSTTCFRTEAAEQEFLSSRPQFPVTRAEERAYVATSAHLGQSCTATSRNRLAHMSTANVARDMDLLRQALGDEKLSYVGYSYGTYLGATYARLFPGRVRALVLDGTLDPAAYSGSNGDSRPLGARIGQGRGAHETFAEFNRLCAEAGPQGCSLAALGDPATVVNDLFERLRTEPVQVLLPDGTSLTITYDIAVAATFLSLYEPTGWPGLADLLAELAAAATGSSARTTSGSEPLQLNESQFPSDITERLRREDYVSIGNAFNFCVETRETGRPGGYAAVAAAQDRKYPHFGRFRAWVGIECEFMPVRDADAYTGPWKQKVDEPVLVIGTRFDPATPYSATHPFADRFPDGRMLTLDGWGHTTLGKSECADAAVAAYLVDLEATDGATCAPDSRPFDPAG